ncbi:MULTISPECIES: hypothetical protein [Terrabacteria group]|uniref:hypothetical protein n=1 Tax=Bacillati TaxID=1783272 RepID=UPI001C6E7064|nr:MULTISPECIES: hypothetical protein [Terrabacteria group]MBW9211799.1 hypothetical protein [Trueperella sp. zg.1013]
MKKIMKLVAIVALSVLVAACANNNSKKAPATENAMKEFAKNMQAEGATVKMVYWPVNAKDSVRVTLDSNKDKEFIKNIAKVVDALETKTVTEKPVLPQTSVVVSFEADVKDVTYNVSFYKEGYATYKNFKTGEKQILQVSNDVITSMDKLAKAYTPAK